MLSKETRRTFAVAAMAMAMAMAGCASSDATSGDSQADVDAVTTTSVSVPPSSGESGNSIAAADEPPPEPEGLFVAARVSTSDSGSDSDFSSISEAVAAAVDDDEIILRSGTHFIEGEIVVDKRVVIRAEVAGEAIVTSSEEPPTSQRNETLPVGFLAIRGEGADGTEVRDLVFENIGHSFTGQAILVEEVKDVVIAGNAFTHTGARAIIVFDTQDVIVENNQMLNPYLPDDEPNNIADRLDNRTSNESYMDYGVMVYGSTRPIVRNNYFFGIFHQALSFKEGNTDATATGNTFEGFAFTALFLGQNNPGGNSFERFGLPDSAPDGGIITVSDNLFRPVADDFGEYLPGIALRLSYVEADVLLNGNIVEGAFIPLQVDCNAGGEPNCVSGSLTLSDNIFNGTVRDSAGGSFQYEGSSCLNLRDVTGADLRVAIRTNTIVGCGLPYELAGFEFELVGNVIADMIEAGEGTPNPAADNLVWEAPGFFGDDAVVEDPVFAAVVGRPQEPKPSLAGASATSGVYSSSDESPSQFSLGKSGARAH